MDDCERQKKLTVVLQLLGDLHHFNGSSMHKCQCEICSRKSSLIYSIINLAIDEVGDVIKSLSLPGGEFSSQMERDERVSRQFQFQEFVGDVCSGNRLSGGDDTAERKLSEIQQEIRVSQLEKGLVKNLKVGHSESEAGSSMLSSTQRDSGAICENLLQSSHSISPIRSDVEASSQHHQIISPTFVRVPAIFYPASSPMTLQNVSSMASGPNLNPTQTDSSSCVMEKGGNHDQCSPSADTYFQNEEARDVGKTSGVQDDDDGEVLSVGELMTNLHMSDLHKDGKNKLQINRPISPEKESERNGTAIPSDNDEQANANTRSIGENKTEKSVSVDNTKLVDTQSICEIKIEKGVSRSSQLVRDDSVLIVRNKNVLLSDARLSWDEDMQKEGDSESQSRTEFDSAVDSFKLSDSYMWRPWEVKDDIYRIISDSSIGEEDEEDRGDVVALARNEKCGEDCNDDIRVNRRDEDGGESERITQAPPSQVVNTEKEQSKVEAPFVKNNKVQKNISFGGLDVLSSPCKKTRGAARKKHKVYDNTRPSDSSLSTSSDDSLHNCVNAVIKSPFRRSKTGRQSANSSSYNEDSGSELDSFDAAFPGTCNNFSASTKETNKCGEQINPAIALVESTTLEITSSLHPKNVLTLLTKRAVGDGNHSSSSSSSNDNAVNKSFSPSKLKSRKSSKCRQTLFGSTESGKDKENMPVVHRSLTPSTDNTLSLHLNEDLEIMRNMSNKALNEINIPYEYERKETGIKYAKENKKLQSDFDTELPEIIVTNFDVSKGKVLDSTGKMMEAECIGRRSSKNTDKSLLDILTKQTESHSFCNIPYNNHNESSNGCNHISEVPKNSLSKMSRVAMKTFPPKHKTRQVFVKSTNDNNSTAQHSSHVMSSPRTHFPVMGTSSAMNKLSKKANSPATGVTKTDPNREISTHCSNETVTRNLGDAIMPNYKDVEVGNENKKNHDAKSSKKQDCCFDDKVINDDVNVKNIVSTAKQSVWGAPAIVRSNVLDEGTKTELDSQEDLQEDEDNVRQGCIQHSGPKETDCNQQLLWEKFSKLNLAKDIDTRDLNKSLPASSRSKNDRLYQQQQQHVPEGKGTDMKDLMDFEANQSFPRMTERRRMSQIDTEEASSLPARTVGTQNLALAVVHQNEAIPSTLKMEGTGLAPRNRRSVFGFSPPNGMGRESAASPHSVHHPQSMAVSPPPSPAPQVDRLWSVFDVSQRFPRPPTLEEILFNCVASGICVVDTSKQGKVMSVNESFQQLVGIHEKVLGLRLSRFIKVPHSSSDLAMSTPQQVILSDGSLTSVPGKMVSCITARGRDIPVSMWCLPVRHHHMNSRNNDDVEYNDDNDNDEPRLTICVITLVAPISESVYVNPSGELLCDDFTPEEIESQSLTVCKGLVETGLLVVDSCGLIHAWDDSFFSIIMGLAPHLGKKPLSDYLCEVVNIWDPEDDSGTANSSRKTSPGRFSSDSSPLSPPMSASHILSQFGGEVWCLKESVTPSGDDLQEGDIPRLVLPAACFVAPDEDINDEDDEVLFKSDTRQDQKDKTNQTKQMTNNIFTLGQLRNPGPSTSTPCKVVENVVCRRQFEDENNDDDGHDDDDDDEEKYVEMDRGIYSAKFDNQHNYYSDVTFKLGSVETKENGVFFCLWFSEAETNHDVDDDDKNKDIDSDISDIEIDHDNSVLYTDGRNTMDTATSKLSGDPSQKRLNQSHNTPGNLHGESKKAEISLGQFITDQAGLNQSLNATVGEDTLDLDQAVLGSFADKYRILETLGQGSFGFVRRAFPLSQEVNSVVVKFIKKSSMLEDSWRCETMCPTNQVPLEVSVLQKLDHENIVKLLDVHQNDQFVQLVMEDFASLDLFDFIDQAAIDEGLACHIFKQISQALAYLHTKSILHRDIKDENVIINNLFHCKLIDFGSAAYFLPPGEVFDKFRGTMEYCSPEVHLTHQYRGPELDAWALGVTLYTIVFRENPYGADLVPHQMTGDHLPHSVSHDLTEVLFGLLCCDPDKRLTVAQALECPWTMQDVDLSVYNWDDLFPNSDDCYVEY